MSKNNENKLVPKLRFPEFTNEIWKRKTIDETCEVLNNLRKPLTSNLREKGEYPYYGASGIIDFVKDFIFNERLLLIGEDGAKWGAYEKTAFIADGKYWVNNHAHVLKPTGVVDTLLENYLVKLDLSPFITGAAPPKLTLGKLKSIPVPIPNSRKEQQKIAACLSSLDEVITAESQKLEVLKDHKKGLLQNLLPQAGETVPKFRFKEFEDSGEWVEKRLDEIADFLKGKGISKADVDDKGKQPCIRYGELYTHYGEVIKEIKSFTNLNEEDLMLSEPNDVIIPSSGETKEDIATASCVKLGGVALGGDLNILRSSLNGDFLAYYLSHGLKKAISKIAQGDAVVHLYATQLKKLIIRVPIKKKEQERIADMISSLDDIINIQNQKLEALQFHKKGLLQGLFPNLNEVTE